MPSFVIPPLRHSFIIRHVSFVILTSLAACTATPELTTPTPPPQDYSLPTSTGHNITPPASFAQALGNLPVNSVLTPDKKFAVTTNVGYREYLHLIRLSDGRSISHLDYPNSKSSKDPAAHTNGLYYGLAIADGGRDYATLYAAQGGNDSIAVVAIAKNHENKIALTQLNAINTRTGDFPSGLALDARGFLYAANQAAVPDKAANPFEHPGSIAIYSTSSRQEVGRYTFKDSFFGTSNFPLAITVIPDGSKLYVASERDAAVYALNTTDPAKPALLKKIPTGALPSALLLTGDHQHLYVANADSDTISVIDTASDSVISTIALRPDVARDLPGATPLALALSPDEHTLYVALADMNAVAVVDLRGIGVPPMNQAPATKPSINEVLSKPNNSSLQTIPWSASPSLLGYIPTAWYPSSLALTSSGKLLVTSSKGASTRLPNASPRHSPNFLVEGNAQLLDIPTGDALKAATEQVLKNNHFERLARPIPEPLASITRKSGKINHIVYIIKENRTYDQVLGDIPNANGDLKLCIFPEPVTPNQHALAKRFGILDNIFACGEVSGDGWNWSTESMANPYVIRNVPYSYSGRGRKFDFEGSNNGYPTGGIPLRGPDGNSLTKGSGGNEEGELNTGSDSAATTRPSWKELPPPNNLPNFPAIPDVAQAPGGHIWDLCNAHKLPFRNYGFFVSLGNWPTSTGLQPADHNLAGKTDIDFPRFILEFPDSDAPALLAAQTGDPGYLTPYTTFGKFRSASRYTEWRREFQLMLDKDPTGNAVPALTLLRLPCDHTHGAKPNTRTPTSFVADNDYAVGQVIDAISHSPIWPHTAIFIIEDDAQDGPDHVDCHRTTGYVISPYLKPAASGADNHFYNTNSLLRTIEILLDLPPMTQYDATATLIQNWTDTPQNLEPYTAIMPDKKYFAQKNPPKKASMSSEARRLAEATEKMDFEKEDAADAQLLNEIIWKTVRGETSEMPAPKTTHLLSIVKNKPKDDDD